MKREQAMTWEQNSKKLAVFFPGIGYTTDKPLLYYTKKLAVAAGYDFLDVVYENLPKNAKGSDAGMKNAFFMALEQTRKCLSNVPFDQYEELLFVSKSIGTAVACAYQRERGFSARNIYFTPVAETFSCIVKEGIVFHGTKDPWVATSLVQKRCREEVIPIFITENANHSLETGVVQTDLRNLEEILREVEDYIER